MLRINQESIKKRGNHLGENARMKITKDWQQSVQYSAKGLLIKVRKKINKELGKKESKKCSTKLGKYAKEVARKFPRNYRIKEPGNS